jgi:DNA-binding response OmpR family regulator
MKILLVTGNVSAVRLWRDALAPAGHEIDAALSCEEAFGRACSGMPGLIVLGDTDGSPELLARQLKADARTAAIPVAQLADNELERPRDAFARALKTVAVQRVLIAEDDRQMALLLSAVLSKDGFEVATVHDGQEALREIKRWKPHILVLDIMLPVVDGFHICQTINEDHTYDPRPKIIIISGRNSDWDQNLGAACGAECYMVKPFSNVDFLQEVREIAASINAAEKTN